MDPDLVVDKDVKQRLIDGGMDNLLATHFAHLFIRDPNCHLCRGPERARP